jgi:hypothetical protein
MIFFLLAGFGCQRSDNSSPPDYDDLPGYASDDDDTVDGTGGGGTLTLPFATNEAWPLTRGYNNASHVDYGYDWVDDRYALDFALPGCQAWRKPIHPIQAGTVELTGYSSFGYGNYVLVDHGDGYKSRYAHFDEVMVESGDVVTTDDVIGLTGNSGNVSGVACPDHPGTHLHVALYRFGEATLPEPMSGHTNFTVGCRYGHDNWIDCNGNGLNDHDETVGDDDDDDDATPPQDDDDSSADDDDSGDDDDDTTPLDPCDWTVPTDVSTIQQALGMAGLGERICVEPGSYSEDLVFPAWDVELVGAGTSSTHIYGVATGLYTQVVTMDSGQTRDTLLQGFTLHGAGAAVIWMDGASPTLQNLEVECELADYGMGFFGSSAIVQNVHIDDCNTYGITAYGGSVGLEFENMIVEWSANAGLRAGGGSSLSITNSAFHHNGAVGIHLFDASATLSNSIVTTHTMVGVTLSDPTHSFDSSYNTYYGNALDLDVGLNMGLGDDTQDPLFGNTWTDDYTLQSSSPAIDAGNPDYTFDDADMTRNDKGAYGGPLSMSW